MNVTLWPISAVILCILILLCFRQLNTRYDQEGVHYRMYPLTAWRTIFWSDIAYSIVTTYEYTGYGIRWSFGRWIYDVGGTQGLYIKTTTGKRVIIGTQRPDELRAFLATIALPQLHQ